LIPWLPSSSLLQGLGAFAPAESKEVMFNPRADTLYAPVQGPAGLPPGMKRDTINNTPTGHVEHTNINAFLFDQQYHTFHCYGFAADPTVGAPPRAMVGDAERLQAKAAHSVFDPRPSARQTRHPTLSLPFSPRLGEGYITSLGLVGSTGRR